MRSGNYRVGTGALARLGRAKLDKSLACANPFYQD
jgi:hypothetical protein